MKMGKVKDVFDGNVVLGSRTKFVFYEVTSVKAAVRTPWVMYEYALLHHLKVIFLFFLSFHSVYFPFLEFEELLVAISVW